MKKKKQEQEKRGKINAKHRLDSRNVRREQRVGEFQPESRRKLSKARNQRSLSAVFISVYKPVGLCTGECIHGQKKTRCCSYGLMHGWDYTGRLANGILRQENIMHSSECSLSVSTLIFWSFSAHLD